MLWRWLLRIDWRGPLTTNRRRYPWVFERTYGGPS